MTTRGTGAKMPDFVEPMLATLFSAPFDDPGWLFEIKWDGFRVEAVVRDGAVRIWTRGQQDTARYFGEFLDPPGWIGAGEAIVDGEMIAMDARGEPDFALLQDSIRHRTTVAPGTSAFVYEVFDLLWLDGRPLLDEPLEERRRRLTGVLRADPRVRLSEHIEAEGLAFFEAARERGLEGIMAKDRRSQYLPGRRSDAWRKVKIRPEQELVVGGWRRGLGYASDLGALLVGIHEDGELRYAGKIGAGFTKDTRAELLSALAGLEAEAPPFSPAPPRSVLRDTIWVRPALVVRAEFAGWTGDGLVRQASYKGIDRGKDPRKVIRERPR